MLMRVTDSPTSRTDVEGVVSKIDMHDTNSISRCISEFAPTPSKLVRLLPLTAY
jgi:hypothetical protein